MSPAELLLFRRAIKLTQTQFAKLVGKSRPTISTYERGLQPIPLSFKKHIELLRDNYPEKPKNACEKCGMPFLSEKTKEGYYLSVRQCSCEFPPPLNDIEITLKNTDNPAKVRRKTKEAIKTYMQTMKKPKGEEF